MASSSADGVLYVAQTRSRSHTRLRTRERVVILEGQVRLLETRVDELEQMIRELLAAGLQGRELPIAQSPQTPGPITPTEAERSSSE